MRIARVDMYRRDLSAADAPFRMSRTAVAHFDSTIIRLESDARIVGWGETCPHGPVYQPHHGPGARAAISAVAPALIGMDPRDVDLVHAAMDGCLAGHAYAKAAVDIALWDIAAKAQDRRVCDLLGGARHARVPAYYSISVDDAEAVADAATAKARQGFGRLQIKAGGRTPEADIAAIRAAHAAVGDAVRLVVDANRGWTTRDVRLVAAACADIPVMLEQPCAGIADVAAIRSQVPQPIYLDESAEDLPAVLDALGRGLADGFALKLTRAGGITAMRAIRDVCAARSIPHTCDDAWGGDIVAAACVHLAASVPGPRLDGVWLAAPHLAAHDDPAHPVAIENGTIAVPDGPGLGVTPSDHALGEYVAAWGEPRQPSA